MLDFPYCDVIAAVSVCDEDAVEEANHCDGVGAGGDDCSDDSSSDDAADDAGHTTVAVAVPAGTLSEALGRGQTPAATAVAAPQSVVSTAGAVPTTGVVPEGTVSGSLEHGSDIECRGQQR